MAVRFLDCELDPGGRLLLRGGAPVHLTPKALDLLVLLVAERPRAVGKTELLERVWPGTFVTDASLARTVHEIRESIGDSTAIRTVHGHGYAFGLVAEEVGPTPRLTSPAPPVPSAWLVIDGRALPLAAGTSTIGRDPAVSVPIASRQASWHHASIQVSAAGALIEDLGSKNGTAVNGVRIDAPTTLRDADVIEVASVRLVFLTGEVATTTETSGPS